VLGVSSILADGVAMAVGDYLSSKAYDEYVTAEKAREHWEYQNYREGEVQEVIEILVKRGMELADAQHIVPILAQYEDLFVNFMVSEELGLQVSHNTHLDLAINSFIMFLSFVFFGLFPLIPFFLGPLDILSSTQMLQISCGCTAFALFLLGAIKSTFRFLSHTSFSLRTFSPPNSASSSWIMCGIESVALGGACALVAYGVGKAANLIISNGSS
jgi:VIT1/CCC1 family predicted Fe2+/Mn2+ transporter